jgi:hypothetical protein
MNYNLQTQVPKHLSERVHKELTLSTRLHRSAPARIHTPNNATLLA